ncbi:YkvA family protein [Acinetobacter baumannii]
MSWVQSIKEWAKRLKKQIIMLWFASRHPQMPWLPILIWLAVRFTPQQVIFDAEQQAKEWLDEHEKRPKNYLVAVLIILIWLTLAVMAYFYFGGGL